MAHIDAGKTTTTGRILSIPEKYIVWVRSIKAPPLWTDSQEQEEE